MVIVIQTSFVNIPLYASSCSYKLNRVPKKCAIFLVSIIDFFRYEMKKYKVEIEKVLMFKT